MPLQVFQGTVFEVPELQTLNIISNALVVVRDNTIECVLDCVKDSKTYATTLDTAISSGTLTKLKEGQYLLPGLVDLHIHAPQWPQLGKALDKSLEVWLQEYTFPLEAKYSDVEFAAKSYNSLVSTLLANGTTTAAYFSSIHLESSVLLAKICIEKGQRAVVGRVAMDLPEQCPKYYRDPSPRESVDLSEEFLRQVLALPKNETDLVQPAVIPRFIPTSSHEALEGLGALVKKYRCYVQTHCSESDWEHQHVVERYKMHDAHALDQFGFLTRRTILAHSNFLSCADMQLVKERGAAVAHCPLSNAYFSGAVFPLRKALDMELHVGMGTDISGGPTASLFETCRHAVSSARLLESGVDPTVSPEHRSSKAPARIDHIDAFYVATTNGGISLDMKIGRIAPGYLFDALVVDTTVTGSNLCVFENIDTLEDIFQKIVYNISPLNIVKTYVDGRLVFQR